MKQAVTKRSTIAEIAAKAGVSIPTVSRVLHGRPDVAPETRQRVEQVIKDSGFVHSRAKPSPQKGGIIDMLVPGLDSMYSVEIVRGVEEALARTPFRLGLSVSHDSLEIQQSWVTKTLNGSTMGTILVLAYDRPRHFDTLRQHNIPFVVVDHRGELGPDIPSVGATNWHGARTAIEYLLSLGHRRIAMITGPSTHRCSRDRVAGYRVVLEDAGVPILPEYIRPGTFKPEAGYEQTCALLDLPEPPTAIFAGCDAQAMGVYSALRARGLDIPRDVSVLGFDDIPIASIATPALTTVRQPLMEMGRVATTMLLHLIAGEPLDSTRVELTTTLVERNSCAPLCSFDEKQPSSLLSS
jgi:LacI family transcriptional regulator